MTENEIRLVNLIRNHPNPEQAFLIALDIICKHLEQSESLQSLRVAYLSEYDGASPR